MHLLYFLLPLVAGMATEPHPEYIFSNPPQHMQSSFKIPTARESAVLARRILALTPLATLSTIFPPRSSTLENRPDSAAGKPHGLMDYIADCEDSGNPTMLAINVETSFKNAAAGSNVSISVSWAPQYAPTSRIGLISTPDPSEYSAANLPRFALLGYLEKLSDSAALRKCFVESHQDAKWWLPGSKVHTSEFVRLVVQEVYWIGGFGDRAYIGWIDKDVYGNITESEWESVKLPGERKGWKEWAVGSLQWEL